MDHTIDSNTLVNTLYGIPPTALNFAINKPNAQLADFETKEAVTLKSRNSSRVRPR